MLDYVRLYDMAFVCQRRASHSESLPAPGGGGPAAGLISYLCVTRSVHHVRNGSILESFDRISSSVRPEPGR